LSRIELSRIREEPAKKDRKGKEYQIEILDQVRSVLNIVFIGGKTR